MTTEQNYPFLQSLRINHVRHLKDIDIEIDTKRPRHLILTGPNGCGKTSVLQCLKDYLQGIPQKHVSKLHTIQKWHETIAKNQNYIKELTNQLVNTADETQHAPLQDKIRHSNQTIGTVNELLNDGEKIVPRMSELTQLKSRHHRGEFLIAFFDAKRTASIQAVSGVKKMSLQKVSPIDVDSGHGRSLASQFLQYLVNQVNRAAMLHQKGDAEGEQDIEQWFAQLTERFRWLFNNQTLELKYDIDEMDYWICMDGREPFRFVDQLSDGYSAAIHIIAELLLRMEAVSRGDYSIPGIVLIDEIETHLHIELQKQILPFLTDFFPNIQFVVTTHSPFVLTSLPDSVIFDLDKQKRQEYMAPLSASTVVEDYFESDLYSAESKRMIERFGELVKRSTLTDTENRELEELKRQLDVLNYDDAPALVAYYQNLRAMESAQ
jgi:ABC-type cobalamin/Fe3+-siderophores transport system ATPase subunit